MFKLGNVKIGARLGLAFGATLALACAVVVTGIVQLANLEADIERVTRDRLPKILLLGDIADDVNLVARELRNTLIFQEPERVTAAMAAVNASRQQIAKVYEEFVPTIRSDEGKRLLATTMQARAAFNPEADRMMDLVRAGKRDEAVRLLEGKVRPAQLAYMAALEKLRDFQVDFTKKAASEAAAAYQMARLEAIGLLAVMIALGAGLAWWITRSITRPIGEAVAVANRVADGDLSSAVQATTSDETGQLLGALARMNANLTRIVANVRACSDSIATGASQVAAGSGDLSQRTEEQAANLEQTAASMEQMNATVQQNAKIAEEATQLADAASAAAVKGGDVVSQVVTTMQDISASSGRIADIIGVIDGIAFQTNILALNAAVEAARAGEQGRGFAVVAGEVRSLAQRCAEAAREIKSLIGQSVEKVDAGSRLVGDAGTTMEALVARVKQVAGLINEMGNASREQTQGIGQVSDAVAQLDQVTQQNAALVEESAAAAGSLSQQASKLTQAVAVFRLSAAPA